VAGDLEYVNNYLPTMLFADMEVESVQHNPGGYTQYYQLHGGLYQNLK
jgi:hypothetical protein